MWLSYNAALFIAWVRESVFLFYFFLSLTFFPATFIYSWATPREVRYTSSIDIKLNIIMEILSSWMLQFWIFGNVYLSSKTTSHQLRPTKKVWCVQKTIIGLFLLLGYKLKESDNGSIISLLMLCKTAPTLSKRNSSVPWQFQFFNNTGAFWTDNDNVGCLGPAFNYRL